MSWHHPRSLTWHQLDLVITRRDQLSSVLQTSTFHNADCNTEHSLICCRFPSPSKVFHRQSKAGKPRIDVTHIKQPDKVVKFQEAVTTELATIPENASSLQQQWDRMNEATHKAAMTVFGEKRHKSQDWFNDNAALMLPAIEEKRSAMLQHKTRPTRRTLEAAKEAKRKVQRSARYCAN